MDLNIGLLVFTLLVGCLGVPTPDEDLSVFFNYESRIVGGIEAAPGSHPHMVAFTVGFWLRSLVCGGSVITQRTVLTAVHCLAGYLALVVWHRNSLRVIVGTNRWNRDGDVYRLSRNVTHPHYVVGTIKNDLTLLITAEDVVLSPRVQIVPITYDFIREGVAATVAGWGSTRLNGASVKILQEYQTTTIDGNHCVVRADQASLDLNMRPPPVDPQLEVCTLHSAGVGNCHGDSGSAITRNTDGAQFGVTSWVFACVRGVPDVYVRLSAYRSWLEANIV